MTDTVVGVQLLKSPYPPGIAAGPLVHSSATNAQRTRAAEEAGKAAKILSRASAAQQDLFRYLADSSPEGRYVVTKALWLETILKATKGVSEQDMVRLRALDWAERAASPDVLRREVMTALKGGPP